MEKIAIISDVHANLTALKTVMKDIKNRKISHIFCLGDSITKCTRPAETIDIIKKECEIILLGNCDYAICRPEAKNKKFWTRELIGEERANFIANLPVSHEFYLSGYLIRLFHASPYGLSNIFNPTFTNKGTSFTEEEIKKAMNLFKNTEFIGKTKKDKIPDVIGYGHIHTPFIFRIKNKTIFNPGSVGNSVEMLNNDINDKSNKFSILASYIILEGEYNSKKLSTISYQLVRVPYDTKKEIELLEKSDMPYKQNIIRTMKSAISNRDMYK